jgi:hypothetical protein
MGNWDGFGSSGLGWRALTAITLFAALTACGGKSLDNDGGGDPDPNPGGTGQGGSGNKAGSATGGSSKGGSSAGSSQGGSAPLACEALDDQPGSHIEVVIHNRTAVPIHLGQTMVDCGVSPLYQVQTADGAPLPSLGNCRSPCQSLRSMGPGGCGTICAFPSSVRLLPAETFCTSWDARYQEQGELPQECVPEGSSGTCDQARRIQPGVLTFSAQAGLSTDCAQTAGGMCSPCTPNGEGGCTTPGSVIGGMLLFTSSTVMVDASFGVLDAAPPSPGNPGMGAPVPAPRVDLIFTDL